ncbi:NAD(P)-binding domain-containing protein [Natronosporangium hydrolyticum]|uniref:NAD(P)-binding domain-containing protein n=1 Tax=Natronosporangium hydrolyticum TaxID=2811111 RepID=A0A895YRA6_9ACTN|nr:FAD-dependent oxidoreductase [Natronosporangium hydrolyticum]QSB16548.1 NAD(P)-binding domain-containing protein [Natronosporangium hydrolyticum]
MTDVVIIGAGPVGLAAAAHAVERGLEPLVLEADDEVGAAVRQWGQVRLFSPWRFNIDPAAGRLLTARGWTEPEPDELPTGADLVARYLSPLAETPELAGRIRTGTRVTAVSRAGVDKVRSIGRDRRPLLVRTVDRTGAVHDLMAPAVIDASGTWGQPAPLGTGGLPAPGERAAAGYVAGALPDVFGADRDRFAGRHTLVVGMGHSAANTLLDLAELAEAAPGTRITWAIRAASPRRLYGGGAADALPARGELGTRLQRLVAEGAITLVTEFQIARFEPAAGGPATGPVRIHGITPAGPREIAVDAVVGAAGFRPDLRLLQEVRLDLDPALEAPAALAPLIDPNNHSCGTVPPHGERQLAHPEPGFYVAGMKSYGRAPTFLLATGYEQVRSIVAALAGDRAAADEVRLELPETGVCSTDAPEVSGRGLSTGVVHGYAGEEAGAEPAGQGPVAVAVADRPSSCCG